jgi:hypothetical protein
MKTTYRRLLSALFCAILVVAMLAGTSVVQGQGVVNMDFYFATIPVYGSSGFSSSMTSVVDEMKNNSTSPISLILPGSSISAVNVFSFPGNTGNELLAGAHVSSSSTFTLDQLTWIFSSSAWSSTDVYSGMSFGAGFYGANGSTVYTSGSSTGVALTDVWVTPEAYTYLLNSGETINQGLFAMTTAYGSTQIPITLSCTLNGVSSSGTVFVCTPEPTTMSLLFGSIISIAFMRRKK